MSSDNIAGASAHFPGLAGVAAARPIVPELTFTHVLTALVALTLVRIIGLHFSVVDLFFDEAQYWTWSRELAFGYFSKPPLLAWVIAATDPICGSSEACVRLGSPLIHLGTSLLVYAIADRLYGRQPAAWAALAFALGIGLSFSSRIISTDVPLLFFWAAALLAYLHLMSKPDWRWTLVLGVSFGLGLLSKYAMIYFLLGVAWACIYDRDARALLKRKHIWIALLIGVALLLPNLYWNATHDFLTFKHTGDNISGDGFRFRWTGAGDFIGSQFAVMGPMVFASFLWIVARHLGPRVTPQDKLMLAFAIPPLLLVTALSFVRGANGNWAAPSVISMTVLAVAWWFRFGWKHWLRGTITLGLFMQALLIVSDAFATRINIPALGARGDIYQRTLGWRSLGLRTADLARATGARTVASEGRAETAAEIYYLRDEPVRALSWPVSKIPDHQFDLTRAMDSSAQEPVLFVTYCPVVSRLERFYSEVTPLGDITTSTGPTTKRQFHAFKLTGRKRDIEPIGICSEAAE
ncbi:ArnT family glycosyltransferase [Rhodoplanes sp. Z2-YC6860]|uniref:ArnT family glycosyltransferase n=1 Tax=Rhodoplanes sp. Z2-YC6860 TaxID=674703 RepID=UPI00078D3403|nr:glycosyltransferase family 39 protein [Rhodoplanes sp. Z2-YC6860]AMN44810.1 glycosyl transferase family 39 [Rhodoplanes sp. Z2-YC6860]